MFNRNFVENKNKAVINKPIHKENSKLYVGISLEYEGDRGKDKFFAKDFENTDDFNLKINTSYRSVDDCVDEVIMYCSKIYK